MNKKVKITLVVVISIIIICSLATFATEKFITTHPNNGIAYIENPEPIYKDNADKQDKDFVPEEKCLEKIAKTPNSHKISSEIKTWKQHLEKEQEGNAKNLQISPNRKVRVIKTEFPDGIDTKAGFYDKAILTSIFDAETGNFLGSTTTGEYKGKSDSNHSQPPPRK